MKRSFDAIEVLLVEDNRLAIVELQHALQDIGFTRIKTAGNGSLALQFLKNTSELPQLIITDLRMPVMGGYELLQRLAEQDYTGNVVVISGVDEEIIQSVGANIANTQLNVVGFLSKPLDVERLQTVLQEIYADG